MYYTFDLPLNPRYGKWILEMDFGPMYSKLTSTVS